MSLKGYIFYSFNNQPKTLISLLGVSFKMDNVIRIEKQLSIIIHRQSRNFHDSSYFESVNSFSHLMRYNEVFDEVNLVMKFGASDRLLGIY